MDGRTCVYRPSFGSTNRAKGKEEKEKEQVDLFNKSLIKSLSIDRDALRELLDGMGYAAALFSGRRSMLEAVSLCTIRFSAFHNRSHHLSFGFGRQVAIGYPFCSVLVVASGELSPASYLSQVNVRYGLATLNVHQILDGNETQDLKHELSGRNY